MNRIIFVDHDATVRAPMAMEIMKNMTADEDIRIEARGLVVLFPEPVNQKVDAVLVSNGIKIESYRSMQLVPEEVDEDTCLVLIDEEDLPRTLELVGEDKADRVRVLNALCGEELGIMDPYGGALGSYGICYETLTNTIRKLVTMMREGEFA